MIASSVNISKHINVEEMDSDGFLLVGEYPQDNTIWISHEQLDDLAKLSALVREVNGDA